MISYRQASNYLDNTEKLIHFNVSFVGRGLKIVSLLLFQKINQEELAQLVEREYHVPEKHKWDCKK